MIGPEFSGLLGVILGVILTSIWQWWQSLRQR